MKTIEFYKSEKGFVGKNVVITGATGGIGRVLVESLVSLGARVVAITRSEKKIFEVLSKVCKRENFDYEIMNLESPIVINRGFKSIITKLKGKIDILILCHAVFQVGTLMETNIDDFDSTMNLNVRSCFHLMSLATPFLKLSCGNVVAISSLESLIPVKDSFMNSLSKVKLVYLGNVELPNRDLSLGISTFWD